MVRQFLLMAGIGFGISAFAGMPKDIASSSLTQGYDRVQSIRKLAVAQDAQINYNQAKNAKMRNAPAAYAQWKRPAGQFWATGYDTKEEQFTYLTPLVIRPWVDYEFLNVSQGFSGEPTWVTNVLTNPQTGEYEKVESKDKNLTASFLRYELTSAPRLSYDGAVAFPTQFDGLVETKVPFNEIMVLANDVADVPGFDMNLLVSSHFWGMFTRQPQKNPITYVRGAKPYEGMASGQWFGTNAGGWNAMATRFEKPDSPYLLNSVHWFYLSSGPIPNNIPLTAYVFKTENDAVEYPNGLIGAELGELIAVAESFVPASEAETEGMVKFVFKEKNPVTGAETNVSLEIEDDIMVIVTGYDADLGNGHYITSIASTDTFDEGYGNLGFLGAWEDTEDGIRYGLFALDGFFEGASLGNTTLGVLADVSYPWLMPYALNQENDVKLPNEGETTEDVQGLEYYLYLMATSETSDFEVTYDGEEECEWLSIADVYDDMEEGENGEEEFTGITGLLFSATPNPTDENRTCVVKISIPAASYEITFRQGSNNTAVDAVVSDTDAVYFDLQGRKVANPGKGLYIKKAGNKTSKVIL